MAPEQARGEPVDARADLYALGLVLWEALTGVRARPAASTDAILALARAGAAPGPAPVELPPALAQVLARATASTVAERYPTARAMAAELDAYLVAARVEAPGPTLAERLAAWHAAAWDGAAPSLTPVADGELGLLEGDAEGSMAVTVEEGGADGAGGAQVPDPAPDDDEPATAAPPARLVGRRAGRGRWLVAAAALAALVAVGIVARPMGRGRSADDAAERAPVADAPASGAAPASASREAVAPSAPSAPRAPRAPRAPTAPRAVAPPAGTVTPDAPPPVAAPRVAAAPPPAPTRRAAPPAALLAAAASPTRAVVVGATPWADFTIDDATEVHETPETVRLSPGRHTLHFSNPVLGVRVDRVIEVPADRDLRHLEHLR